ncbi:MAG: hypothetical protein IT374_14710 [Polyangiaceae bacterium]|nr:hypothetical protein [Polyangiaceae bacterium]
MKRLILNSLLVLSVLGVGLATTGRRGVERVGPQRADTAALERRSASDPGDTVAALRLMRHYVEQGEPGSALAVAARSPAVDASPAGRDLVARALFTGGHASEALTMTRRALQACEFSPCDAGLVARATRREELLTGLVEVGVEDAEKAPELAALTYRRTLRTVRVATLQ